jgi:alkylation response protein AidB-like acyl-CoA dehydrogenase
VSVADELREVVRRSLAGAADRRRFLADEDRPAQIDADLWQLLSGDIGVAGLLIPEELGGGGGTFGELAVVLAEAGAVLAPVPVLSTAGFAVPLLRSAGTPAADAILRRIAAGGVTAAVAWCDDRQPESASFVLDGAAPGVMLAVAGDELWAVEATRIEPMRTLDLTRGMAEVDFVRTEALGRPNTDLTLVSLAAEQVGLAGRILDDAVAYAKVRQQFGRPIGSFQAVKHKLADLLLEVEIGRAALDLAVEAADAYLDTGDADGLRTAAPMVAGHCGEMATLVARESLHVFGGIGFTWEHDAHLYYRRAKADEVLLGHPAGHRRRLAVERGLFGAQRSPSS